MNTSNAFVIYDEKGRPIAYVIKTGSDFWFEKEMTKLTELFKGKSNAETQLDWEEAIG